MTNNKKIFIIEDDPFYSALLQSFLKLKGYRDIHTFSTGKEAIQQVDLQPDLVLLDFDLGDPDYPGKKVLQQIIRFNENIPVIFISGQKSIHEAVQTLKQGAKDYIRKNDGTLEKLDNLLNALFHPESVLSIMNTHKKQKRQRLFFGGLFLLTALSMSMTIM